MTLQDNAVQRMLAKDFVSTWIDLSGEKVAGSSFAHDPTDPAGNCIRGNGEHNMQTLILSPEGELLHIFAGFVPKDEMLDELRFGRDLFRELRNSKNRAKSVSDAHRRRLDEISELGMSGFFAEGIRQRRLTDHRFVEKHPLLPATEFRPEDLVGNATTFFGSSNGSTPKGRTGNGNDAERLLEELRRQAGEQKPPASRPSRPGKTGSTGGRQAS